jgi:FAD/FMN-containing dehydrogenase
MTPPPPAPPAAGTDGLEADLVGIVGAEHVLADPDVTASYGTDWTRRWSARPRALVRPADTAQVAAVVAACARHGVALVPQGGNTGLVGGGVPRSDGLMVVLSTRRLTRLDPVETATAQAEVVAGAGVTLAVLDAHAHAAGWHYGVDLAARDTATIGGTVATNAGGLHVVGHGDTRAQVLGVEAVLADGSVVSRLGGLAKDNGGYDLSRLLVGSEGTLGVVTAVRVRLVPLPEHPPQVTLVGLPDVASMLPLLRQRGLTAAEMFDDEGMRAVCEVAGLAPPLARAWPFYLLLETSELPALPEDADAVVDPRMWAYRDRQAESVAALGVPHKLDVCLPVAGLPAFMAALPAALERARAPRTFVYGHVGDGNLHVNVLGLAEDDEELERAVLPLVAEHGGSIAAEHGVGVAKTAWLHLSRSPAELAAMRRIKDALDPDGVLNPGVLLA